MERKLKEVHSPWVLNCNFATYCLWNLKYIISAPYKIEIIISDFLPHKGV